VAVPTFTELGIAALVLLAVFFVFIYFIVQLRRRRAQMADEPMPTREQLDDRAFNQIHIARAAADRLHRSGVPVDQVLTLLDNAEKARARGDPDTATALARSAQETLVRLRSTPPSRVPPPLDAALPSGTTTAPREGAWLEARPSASAPPPVRDETAASDAPVGRLPKNKAESRFQLNLLEEDLRRSESSTPNTPESVEGRTLLSDGRAAFERGDYTGAPPGRRPPRDARAEPLDAAGADRR
jgi:hypothetical protein